MAKKVVVKKKKSKVLYDPRRDGVTQSALTTWLKCPEKFRLLQMEGLAFQARPASALTWGSIFHDSLEGFYSGKKGEKLDQVFDRWRKKENVTMMNPNDIERWEHMEMQIEVTLAGYVAHWKGVDKELKWVGLEQEFAIPFEVNNMGTVNLRGKMDGCYETNKKLWLFETKTKGQINEAEISDTLERDFQLHFYLLCLKRLKKKTPVGATYNIIRRSSLKLLDRETIAQHGVRLDTKISEDEGKFYSRLEYAVDPEAIDLFENDLHRILTDFLAWYDNKCGPNLKFGMLCNGRFGNCGLLPACYWGQKDSYRKRERPFEELS